MHPDLASIAIGLAGPSSAGAALILISLCVPPLIESEKLSRPQTYALPAIHTALTLFATRMMLTGATPVASVHEKLLPATLWLYPPAILSLFLLSWAALEVTHRRQISSVS